MIKRGCVYWDEFICSKGTPKRVPVLVLSNDDNNAHSEYVNTVRLVARTEAFHPSNLLVPADAWLFTKEIGECIVRCETVSVTKVCDLHGPIAQIDDYWLSRVEDAVKMHLGMSTMPSSVDWDHSSPFYSAPHSPQARQTYPQTPVTPRPNFDKTAFGRYDSPYSRTPVYPPRVTPDAFNDSIAKMYGQVETEAKP